MRLLIVTAVEAEAEAISCLENDHVAVAGIGRTNAATATTLAALAHGPFDAVLSIGLAGSLPGSGLEIGDFVAARECVYAEEGILTPEGWCDVNTLGFPLGDFDGNRVPCDEQLIEKMQPICSIGKIATVATCSGTDAIAQEIAQRTGCIAEAMEGAAVVHAARRLNLPAIEIRVISNTTGHRDTQQWDITRALQCLREASPVLIERLH